MNPAWTIPDQEPTSCEGRCGERTYDPTADGWYDDHGDHYCPNCWKQETPC